MWMAFLARHYVELLRKCGEQMKLRAVSMLPPLTLKLLKAFNWIGPPVWNGFTEESY